MKKLEVAVATAIGRRHAAGDEARLADDKNDHDDGASEATSNVRSHPSHLIDSQGWECVCVCDCKRVWQEELDFLGQDPRLR